MNKFVFILFALVLAFTVLDCQSKESKEEKAKNKAMANKEEFIRILRATGRPGIETVISHLDSTDFFTRSAGRHHTEEGGLVQHSLEVYRIMRCIAWFQPSDRIAVTALLHDMGKIDYGGWHPWRSVKLLGEWGFELTDKEYYAIFYHHKPRYHSR
ncbi:MAG: HD domain-containing protein, partial [Bacteroidales bacterium]|nr:HD domain-containing protein [Bacteroidales bacterium]